MRLESGRHRTADNPLLTKHVVVAGSFARDAGSTPAASTTFHWCFTIYGKETGKHPHQNTNQTTKRFPEAYTGRKRQGHHLLAGESNSSAGSGQGDLGSNRCRARRICCCLQLGCPRPVLAGRRRKDSSAVHSGEVRRPSESRSSLAIHRLENSRTSRKMLFA